ncbi:hypothetical protein NPIL_291891 [Nephila pilipes]|uniref:Uncharacterized protein n=1 Tax=Nephila pilipes TaxID=299642 RepID=A0A8X6TJX9_NEPPI|nr:hypothetical protein NPIL_291891 [Nephila pilipes]
MMYISAEINQLARDTIRLCAMSSNHRKAQFMTYCLEGEIRRETSAEYGLRRVTTVLKKFRTKFYFYNTTSNSLRIKMEDTNMFFWPSWLEMSSILVKTSSSLKIPWPIGFMLLRQLNQLF